MWLAEALPTAATSRVPRAWCQPWSTSTAQRPAPPQGLLSSLHCHWSVKLLPVSKQATQRVQPRQPGACSDKQSAQSSPCPLSKGREGCSKFVFLGPCKHCVSYDVDVFGDFGDSPTASWCFGQVRRRSYSCLGSISESIDEQDLGEKPQLPFSRSNSESAGSMEAASQNEVGGHSDAVSDLSLHNANRHFPIISKKALHSLVPSLMGDRQLPLATSGVVLIEDSFLYLKGRCSF